MNFIILGMTIKRQHENLTSRHSLIRRSKEHQRVKCLHSFHIQKRSIVVKVSRGANKKLKTIRSEFGIIEKKNEIL